ncbi:hypothetical protein AYI70_g4633 [Smittium culicis]|uniref:Uncharacterized protein n=1 Tax=Smittium culicis TaxID=133412 RepID=A0A1R1XYE0_9FUNG|nr:hypothetical protein AYI70_g4633 [Smittium culicis]
MFRKALEENRKIQNGSRKARIIAERDLPSTENSFVHPESILNCKNPQYEPYSQLNLATRISTLDQVNMFMKRLENISLSEIIGQVKDKKIQDISKRAPWAMFTVLKKDAIKDEGVKGKDCYKLIVTDLLGKEAVVLVYSIDLKLLEKLKTGYIISISNPIVTVSRKTKGQDAVFLNLKSFKQILLVGKAKDAVFCIGKLDSSKQCTELVNM